MNSASSSSSATRGDSGFAAEVIVVGGGPTGLMLAAELALGGVDVLVLERRLDQSLPGSRAGGLHSRTLEVLDQRGIVDRFLAHGETMQTHSFGGAVLDISDFPTRHPYGLALPQARIEAILAGWVQELPVRFIRGQQVTAVSQDDDGVDVRLDDGRALRAPYVVGCDGGRSLIRKSAGIAFDGWEATTSFMLAEATMPDDPGLGFKFDAIGRHAIGPAGDGEDRVRFVVQEVPAKAGDEPTLEDVRAGVISVWGQDFGLHSPTWISRFSDAARQATSYRSDRVLIAGDAAHVHSPVGGQGLGTGVQDAVNLGWKLAQVVRGISPEGLLDTYEAERHPVGARVLQGTLATTDLLRGDDRAKPLAEIVDGLVELDEPRRILGARFSGLDIHYDFGEGHPLLGRRMPDLDLSTAAGPINLFSLLHGARGAVINFGSAEAIDLAPRSERVQFVNASYDGALELPALGVVEVPPALLVRPDGYVGWVGSLHDPAFAAALTAWFGASAKR